MVLMFVCHNLFCSSILYLVQQSSPLPRSLSILRRRSHPWACETSTFRLSATRCKHARPECNYATWFLVIYFRAWSASRESGSAPPAVKHRRECQTSHSVYASAPSLPDLLADAAMTRISGPQPRTSFDNTCHGYGVPLKLMSLDRLWSEYRLVQSDEGSKR